MEASWMIRCSSSPKSLSVLGSAPASVRLLVRTMAGTRRRAYDGLLVDAGGTLLQLAKPVEDTYATIGKKYGLGVSEGEIKQGFRRAFAAPWPKNLRYQVTQKVMVFKTLDCKEFYCSLNTFAIGFLWRVMEGNFGVSSSPKPRGVHGMTISKKFIRDWTSRARECTLNTHLISVSKVYRLQFWVYIPMHYANGEAWCLPIGTHEALCCLKDTGVKLAVVSNFDNRLRKLLKDLNVAHLSNWFGS